jgi:hypothetical protein
MSDLITLTGVQYRDDIQSAYEDGREAGIKEERIRQRDKVTDALTSNRHDTVERYLKSTGWRLVAVKGNGTEWIDSRENFRVGLPTKITSKSWETLLRGLSTYLDKPPQAIQADILDYGKRSPRNRR